jgi:hypothetical protein
MAAFECKSIRCSNLPGLILRNSNTASQKRLLLATLKTLGDTIKKKLASRIGNVVSINRFEKEKLNSTRRFPYLRDRRVFYRLSCENKANHD